MNISVNIPINTMVLSGKVLLLKHLSPFSIYPEYQSTAGLPVELRAKSQRGRHR